MPRNCARCNRVVDTADERLAFGKVWHRFCFSCRTCRKLLKNQNVRIFCGDLYCSTCYTRLSNTSEWPVKSHLSKLTESQTSGNLYPDKCENRLTSWSGTKNTKNQERVRLRGGGSEKEVDYYTDDERKTLSSCELDKKVSHVSSVSCSFKSVKPNTGIIKQNARYKTSVKDLRLRYDIGTQATLSTSNEALITHYSPCESFVKKQTALTRSKIPHESPCTLLPSHRRVSFNDVVLEDNLSNKNVALSAMQNSYHEFSYADHSQQHKHNCDIWQADELSSRDDGEYDSAPDCDNTRSFENEEKDLENYYPPTEDNDSFKCPVTNGNTEKTKIRSRTEEIDNKSDSENNADHVSLLNEESEENVFRNGVRLRGGCGGTCCVRCGAKTKLIKSRSDCCSPSRCSRPSTASSSQSKKSDICSSQQQKPCRPKIISYCACLPPCTNRSRCDNSTVEFRQSTCCCDTGFHNRCVKCRPCTPLKSCMVQPCRPQTSLNSPCSIRATCKQPQICCCSDDITSIVKCPSRICSTSRPQCSDTEMSYCRSKSPGCRAKSAARGCCFNEEKCSIDRVSCCKSRVSNCECFGGGPDCQRCGRKVYQAEMQMVSGIPYHNICFSCYCCRKPLEPLTYQENCGEIYCKQCYIRNFGPQGYGYGVGAAGFNCCRSS